MGGHMALGRPPRATSCFVIRAKIDIILHISIEFVSGPGARSRFACRTPFCVQLVSKDSVLKITHNRLKIRTHICFDHKSIV